MSHAMRIQFGNNSANFENIKVVVYLKMLHAVRIQFGNNSVNFAFVQLLFHYLYWTGITKQWKIATPRRLCQTGVEKIEGGLLQYSASQIKTCVTVIGVICRPDWSEFSSQIIESDKLHFYGLKMYS